MVFSAGGDIEGAIKLFLQNHPHELMGKGHFRHGKPHFAGVHDILVKNVTVYCDEKLSDLKGTKVVSIGIQNIIPTTQYADICVENVMLNGVKLSQENMTIQIDGCDRDVLAVQ